MSSQVENLLTQVEDELASFVEDISTLSLFFMLSFGTGILLYVIYAFYTPGAVVMENISKGTSELAGEDLRRMKARGETALIILTASLVFFYYSMSISFTMFNKVCVTKINHSRRHSELFLSYKPSHKHKFILLISWTWKWFLNTWEGGFSFPVTSSAGHMIIKVILLVRSLPYKLPLTLTPFVMYGAAHSHSALGLSSWRRGHYIPYIRFDYVLVSIYLSRWIFLVLNCLPLLFCYRLGSWYPLELLRPST